MLIGPPLARPERPREHLTVWEALTASAVNHPLTSRFADCLRRPGWRALADSGRRALPYVARGPADAGAGAAGHRPSARCRVQELGCGPPAPMPGPMACSSHPSKAILVPMTGRATSTSFVGREEELGRLQRGLQSAAAGEPGTFSSPVRLALARHDLCESSPIGWVMRPRS